MEKSAAGEGAASAPVGRQDEMDAVVRAAHRAVAGQGQVALVTGEVGIGKTTLLHTVVQSLAALGLQVCRGSADVLETHWPFSAIGDCLELNRRCPDRRRAAVAAQIQAEPGSAAQPSASGCDIGLVQQVVALVEDLCEQGPVALVLDDAQWADTHSLMCLQRLVRLAGQLPLLVLLAARSGESTPQLDQLAARLAERGATTVALRPLPQSDVAELLEQLTGAPAGPRLRRLAADAAGNPFYIAALVAALQATKSLSVSKDMAETTQESGPGSVHAAIAQRLGFLPAKVTEVLRVAALLGSRFSASDLAAAADCPPQQVYSRLEVAQRAGVLIEAGEQLAFQHDLVRQALVHTLSVSARQAMHQRLGLALAAAGQPVERVADQLRCSGAALGQAGLDWLAGAADHLVARDCETAVDLLQRALQAADPADARVQRLHVVWADALLSQGRADECLQVATAALAHSRDPQLRTRLRWTLVHRAAADDSVGILHAEQAGLHLAEQAADHPDTSPAQRLQFLAYCAIHLCDLGEYQRAKRMAQAVRASAKDLGETTALSRALATLALVELSTKQPSKAWALLEQAPQRQRGGDTFRASALMDLGRFTETVALLRQPATQAGGSEPAGDMLWRHLYTAYAQFVGGWWDDAKAEIEAGLELPEYADARRALCGLGALIALHRGDLPAAQAYLARSPVHSPYIPADAFTGSFPRWAHARHEQYCGHPAQALELFEHLCYHDCTDTSALWLAVLAPETVRLALEAGDHNRAHDIYALVLEQAQHAEPGVLEPCVLNCQGILEDRTDALLAAADQCRALHRPWQEARCHEDTAALLARRDHRADARHELDLAAAGYQSLDAAWDLARVDAALRTLGYRRGVRGPRRRPSHGWDSLTTTELKVAALVAEGLSNPHIASQLFISRSTVQTHVSNILSKLDLTSRIEVAAQATQHTASTA
ncbi:AAA family ATPase [Streptomyces sp. NBC_01381]|uniref:helix-turn-helix transcriptional regulator n=1 Tax=Streptomyces sp. NBC_01381 TaxID=2903845 RepID=UPI00224E7BA0|nr:helix-turn-helix transcriptional regulator [Streptomyces sp. NBC_01381]MCX4673559.1 AAA family ATPase [Streptomyces sp. NBC_01381]